MSVTDEQMCEAVLDGLDEPTVENTYVTLQDVYSKELRDLLTRALWDCDDKACDSAD